MKDNKNKNIKITAKDLVVTMFLISSIALVLYAQFFIDISVASNKTLEETRVVSKRIAELTQSLDSITLNTDILKSGFLKEISNLPDFPIDINGALMFGKKDPFLGGYITVATDTGSTGGIRYTSQTASNSLIVVPARR
jgi:hypothetical protein